MPLFFNTKLLKIALPVTTLTAATIITATLLFSNREDLKLTSLNDEALQNYDKELNPYEEELMKQESEQEEEDKSKDDSNEKSKDQNQAEKGLGGEVKDAPKKEKTLEELFEEKLENADSKESIRKLLNEPDKLVEELLKGSGVNPPSEVEKDKFLEQAQELAKKFEEDKQGVPTPVEQKDEEIPSAGGEPNPTLEEKEPILPQDTVEQTPDLKNEMDIEQSETPPGDPATDIAEERQEETVQMQEDQKLEPEVEAGKEENTKSGKPESHTQLSEDEEETLNQKDGVSIPEDGEVPSGDLETEPKAGPEATDGGSDENEGGDEEETNYDMDTLTSLQGKLNGAIFSLRAKLS